MRRLRWGRVLFIFFCLAFLGAFLSFDGLSPLKQQGQSILQEGTRQLPSLETASVPQGTWKRLHRLIFLRDAVAEQLNGRPLTPLRDIALPMQQALIAVEDHRFYQHAGVDIESILRASLVNLQFGAITEGGSTITQQLAKNLFLSHEQTMGRKAEEFALALLLEARFSKDEILELYLNTIYFGSGAYGIQEASSVYFGKSPASLSLAEASLLAGLPQAPSRLSPYNDFDAAKKRQSIVLAAMSRYGYITPGTATETQNAALRLRQ